MKLIHDSFSLTPKLSITDPLLAPEVKSEIMKHFIKDNSGIDEYLELVQKIHKLEQHKKSLLSNLKGDFDKFVEEQYPEHNL